MTLSSAHNGSDQGWSGPKLIRRDIMCRAAMTWRAGLLAAMLGMLGLEEKDVKDSDTLASFGVDSMQTAEIRSRLQRALGRPIPLEEVCPSAQGRTLLTVLQLSQACPCARSRCQSLPGKWVP